MICPHCQQEQPETVRFCQNCGAVLSETETTPETETAPAMEDTIVAEPENAFAPPVKKKRIALLIIAVLALLAAGVVACSFVFDWWGTNTPSVPVDNEVPVANESAENLTMDIVASMTSDFADMDMDITMKVDGVASAMWLKTNGIYEEMPLSMEIGLANLDSEDDLFIAVLTETLPHYPPYATIIDINDLTYDQENVYYDMLDELIETDPADFDIETFIDKYDELSELYTYEEEGVIRIEGLEEAVRNLMTVLRDKEWLTETFGYTKTESEKLTVHSIDTDLAVIMKAFAKEITPALGEQTTSVLDAVLMNAEEYKDYTLTASLTMRGTVPELMSLSLKAPDLTCTVDATVTDVNNTVVDVDALKDTVIEANEGFTVCRECQFDPAVYQGYCELCYDMYHCDICLAPVSPEESVCEDCFVPCSVCGEMAHYANNGVDYCFVCYHERFCTNEDGNPVYMDGYCEDCYTPCEFCDSYADYQENGLMCCWSCYYDHFCFNDDGNPVYMDGYCKDCFMPCTVCTVNQGDEGYGGLCGYCYYDQHCLICEKEVYKDGYCEDCFVLCPVCEIAGGDEHFDGLCWDCYVANGNLE